MRWTSLSIFLAGGFLACGEVSLAPSQTSTSTSGTSADGPSCSAAQVDCDHDGSCETTLATTASCGGCSDVCASIHAAASCEQGQCVLACDGGFADCNGLASDGCEAELSIDAASCGGCGNSCGAWGDCFQSTCVEILASAPGAFVGANSLATAGSDLYWAVPGVFGHGVIGRVPMGGGTTTTLVSGLAFPERLRSNGSWLAWSDVIDARLYRMHLPAGPMETLWKPPASVVPYVLELDTANVYFTTGTDVQVVPIQGGTPSVLVKGLVEVSAAHLDGGYLYVADLGPEIEQTEGADSFVGHPEGTIRRVSLSSGAVTLLAQHLDTPYAVITAGSSAWIRRAAPTRATAA